MYSCSRACVQQQPNHFSDGLFLSLIRLLDVIAGRKNPAGLRQGRVMVNGKVVTSKLGISSGYVVQVLYADTNAHWVGDFMTKRSFML